MLSFVSMWRTMWSLTYISELSVASGVENSCFLTLCILLLIVSCVELGGVFLLWALLAEWSTVGSFPSCGASVTWQIDIIFCIPSPSIEILFDVVSVTWNMRSVLDRRFSRSSYASCSAAFSVLAVDWRIRSCLGGTLLNCVLTD